MLALSAALGFGAGGDFGRVSLDDAGSPGTPGGAAADADPSQLRPRSGSGPVLPDFSLAGFGGEGTIDAADLRGTPLVLNFWASWCPFCIEEMPGFEAVHRRFDGAVTFLGVDLQDDRGLARDLIRRTGVTYAMAEDPNGTLFSAIRGVGMPTTLLVTADGHVAERITGPLRAATLEKLILEHLFEERA